MNIKKGDKVKYNGEIKTVSCTSTLWDKDGQLTLGFEGCEWDLPVLAKLVRPLQHLKLVKEQDEKI